MLKAHKPKSKPAKKGLCQESTRKKIPRKVSGTVQKSLCSFYSDAKVLGSKKKNAESKSWAGPNYDIMELICGAVLACKHINIHKWSRLQRIKLNFETITDEEISVVGSLIPKYLARLLEFNLSLGGIYEYDCGGVEYAPERVEISDKGLGTISHKIARNLPLLQKLSLTFHECTKFTDAGVEILAYELGTHLRYLKELTLILKGSEAITDDSLLALGSQIAKSLSQLIKLQVGFERSPNISDNGVKLFSSKIGSLKQLEILKISFAMSMNISDTGISHFSTEIAHNLTRLRELHIDLWRLTGITDQGMEVLASKLRQLSQLRLLFLFLSRCKNIGDKTLEAFGSMVEGLTELKLFELHVCDTCMREEARISLETKMKKNAHQTEFLLY